MNRISFLKKLVAIPLIPMALGERQRSQVPAPIPEVDIVTTYIRNGMGRIEVETEYQHGEVTQIEIPDITWKMVEVSIEHEQGTARKVFEGVVPENHSMTVPVHIVYDSGGVLYEVTKEAEFDGSGGYYVLRDVLKNLEFGQKYAMKWIPGSVFVTPP